MLHKGDDRMSDQNSDSLVAALLRQRALSRWDNEGGAAPSCPQIERAAVENQVSMPANNAAEVGALHIRMIALENLVIALLAAASDRQLEQAREMRATSRRDQASRLTR